jgi:deazaflavin-dependent oxidoreductase (nitroreductase family)
MTGRPSKILNKLFDFGNKVHNSIYRRSGGKFAHTAANLPILLITTYGRKSGKPHTNPVVYMQEGQSYIVSASAGGTDYHPGWYLNLKNRPEAKVEVGYKAFSVKAEITENDERHILYEKFKSISPNFSKYEKNTERLIPVIRLTVINEVES